MSQSYYNQFGQFRTYPPTGYKQPYYGAQPGAFPQGQTFPHGWHRAVLHQQEYRVPGMLPVEQSYIENILRLNKGKLVTVYATFENNKEWNAKIFKGSLKLQGETI